VNYSSPSVPKTDLCNAIECDGFAVVEQCLSESTVVQLITALDATPRHGVRNLLDVPDIESLSKSAEVRRLVEQVLREPCFAVRATLFDKLPSANWKVAWHQDRAIAVREKREVPGFGPWSRKAGIPHVIASPEVLRKMLAIRIHLDDCGEQNGPLRVIPSSHQAGILNDQEIDFWRTGHQEVKCLVRRAGALLMCPLLLHASSAAVEPGRRRVIHIEYAVEELPGGLMWYQHIS
jgi:ectoine hydroxylase-related dioxygenase (phytanoyl-CoA dioxygenase family)